MAHQEGQYGDTPLDGLNVVLYGRMPGNAFQGGWTVGIYLDQRANQQQAEALRDLLRAGWWLASRFELADREYLSP